ncbi:MAG: aspartate kinase [Lishizhenia sp.]
MRVFKFGGASVKDGKAVKNVKNILDLYPTSQLVIVVSAMGKTTNVLEQITDALYNNNVTLFNSLVSEIKDFHESILNELFPENNHTIFQEVADIFENLKNKLLFPTSENYDFEYDQIVSLGEVISTKIIAAYLSLTNKNTIWLDARKIIRTNNNYREGEVDWSKTQGLLQERIDANSDQRVFVTQGFVGHTSEGFTTTLGREGSDYTAGIFAFCLDAKDVTIWKDVPGMLNADPKWFDNTVKLDSISFKEAIELSYYGASVIHPKTIKPLQNKNIPLYVKSFLNPTEEGTVIQSSTIHDNLIPSFIFKLDQVLISITPKDFSFIVEENMSDIFKTLSEANAKINIMQNSALSFSVCLDKSKINLQELNMALSLNYKVKYNEGLELVTIRHYDQATIDRVTKGKEILMEQKTRQTARLVLKSR